MCTPRLPFTSSRQTYGPSESRTPPRAEYCRAQLPVGVWGGANGLTNCASWRRLWQVLGQENIAAPQVLESGLDMADHAGVHGGATLLDPEGRTIRGDQGHLMLEECIASQSEVIRAIVSDYGPLWGPAPLESDMHLVRNVHLDVFEVLVLSMAFFKVEGRVVGLGENLGVRRMQVDERLIRGHRQTVADADRAVSLQTARKGSVLEKKGTAWGQKACLSLRSHLHVVDPGVVLLQRLLIQRIQEVEHAAQNSAT